MPNDIGIPSRRGFGSVLNVAGALTRNVEPRQTPTVKRSALASQADGPPTSDLEMEFAGRRFPDIGRKLIDPAVVPLGGQLVDPNVSVLGALAKPGSGIDARDAEPIKASLHEAGGTCVVDVSGVTPALKKQVAPVSDGDLRARRPAMLLLAPERFASSPARARSRSVVTGGERGPCQLTTIGGKSRRASGHDRPTVMSNSANASKPSRGTCIAELGVRQAAGPAARGQLDIS
jgi:hypothetical protein